MQTDRQNAASHSTEHTVQWQTNRQKKPGRQSRRLLDTGHQTGFRWPNCMTAKWWSWWWRRRQHICSIKLWEVQLASACAHTRARTHTHTHTHTSWTYLKCFRSPDSCELPDNEMLHTHQVANTRCQWDWYTAITCSGVETTAVSAVGTQQ